MHNDMSHSLNFALSSIFSLQKKNQQIYCSLYKVQISQRERETSKKVNKNPFQAQFIFSLASHKIINLTRTQASIIIVIINITYQSSLLLWKTVQPVSFCRLAWTGQSSSCASSCTPPCSQSPWISLLNNWSLLWRKSNYRETRA